MIIHESPEMVSLGRNISSTNYLALKILCSRLRFSDFVKITLCQKVLFEEHRQGLEFCADIVKGGSRGSLVWSGAASELSDSFSRKIHKQDRTIYVFSPENLETAVSGRGHVSVKSSSLQEIYRRAEKNIVLVFAQMLSRIR